MPPKGHARRSTRGAKPSGAPDSSNGGGSGHLGSSNAAFKDDEPVKPRRGAKGRTSSYQLDEPKPSGRGNKLVHPPSPPDDTAKEDEDEESGETRCVCDQAEAETKDMGFMVQCEECDVWQHGICMGIEREEDCPDKYYCELCRPDLHPSTIELAKRSKGHGKKSKSTHSSRTSRSTSPLADSRKTSGTHGSTQTNSKVPPKRRNTMNSRDPDLEHVLDLSRKEAERAGLIPEGGSGGAGSAIGDEDQIDIGAAGAAGRGRKRKRAGESDGGDASRKKRAAGSPDSTRSDHGVGETVVPSGRAKNAKGHSNQSPAVHDSATPTDTTTALGRGRRVRKDKEQSLDLDVSKLKHPNQYTYRGGPPTANSAVTNLASGSSNKPSPAKNARGGEHGPRKGAPQSSRVGATQNQSPSPVPLSYNVPDHFSHLVPLLPHPTPQGISVPIRVELVPTAAEAVDGDGNAEGSSSVHTRIVPQTEKGVKVRWPPKRTTIGEMRRRVRAMMEYVARAQLDAGERERRVEMLRAAAAGTKAEAAEALLGAERSLRSSGVKEERERNGDSQSAATLASADLDAQEAAPAAAKTATTSLPNGDLDTEMVDGDITGALPGPVPAQLKMEEMFEAALPDRHGQSDNTPPDMEESSNAPAPAKKVASPSPTPKSRPKISTSSLVDGSIVAPSALFVTPPTASASTPTSVPTSALRTPAMPNSYDLPIQTPPTGPTTTQLLDELTRELIQFQERFGAGREGKVYASNRAETRERRTRNAAPIGGLDPDMF